MNYRFSVIVPVYNCKSFLNRAVDSVINQPDFSSCELILVDDGSTDGSEKICDSYAKEHENIRVIHQINSGVSVARNSGLNAAQGEWVAFLDSDDYFLDGSFEKMLRFSDSDLICATHTSNASLQENFDSFFEEGVYLKTDISDTLNFLLASRKVFYPCWSKFYKLSIIRDNDIKFPVGIKIAEDMVFVYTYIKHISKIAFLNDSVYYYYVNVDNTTSVIPKSFDTHLYIYNWLCKYFSADESPENELIFQRLASAFVFRSFDSIKTATDSLGFIPACKYLLEILNNETFYTLYEKERYDSFNTRTDFLLNKYIIKRNAVMVCIVMSFNKLKTKILKFIR